MFQKQNIFIYILTTFLTAIIIESCSINETSEIIVDRQPKDLNFKLLFSLEEKYFRSIEDVKRIIEKFNFNLIDEKYNEQQKYYVITATKKDYSIVNGHWDLVTAKFYFNRDKTFIRSEIFRVKNEK